MLTDTNQVSNDEIIQFAAPIMDNLMEGSKERNWEKHTRHFTAGAKSNLSEQDLLQQCERYQSTHGHFAEREVVGVTRHPNYINVIWKQSMTKSVGEYMAVLTLVQQGKNIYVARCWVDLWEPSTTAQS